MDEKQLIEKAKGGDPAAFSELVKKHQEKMLHAAYSFLGNKEDARDIAQELFVKAYHSLPGFKGNSAFSTWLYRILANLCKDFLRKKNVRKNLSVTLKRDEEDTNASLPEDNIPSAQRDALEQLESREMGALIQEAVETLPFQQKSVFTLRYMEGLSLQEIAESLELSEGAVKAHLWQASQKMQKRLAAFAPGRN